MKNVLFFGLLVFLLSACIIPGIGSAIVGSPTPSDLGMATRVSQMLTAMPTLTTEPTEAAQPKVEVATDTPVMAIPTVGSTNTTQHTETPPPATATATVPTATNIAPTTTITGIPIVQPTYLNKNGPIPTIILTPPASDPRSHLGAPTGGDPMDSPRLWNWPTDQDGLTTVDFNRGSMQMTSLVKQYGWRLPMLPPTTNAYYELSARTEACSGKDSYGMIVRVGEFREPDNGYVFAASCDGYFRLFKWDGNEGENGTLTTLIPWKYSQAIRKGSNQPNRLGIMTLHDHLLVFANGYFLGEAWDKSYNSGFFGTTIYSQTAGDDFTVDIDEVSFWVNPMP